jgi:uncharacterized protein YbjT (DUF2867 family)
VPLLYAIKYIVEAAAKAAGSDAKLFAHTLFLRLNDQLELSRFALGSEAQGGAINCAYVIPRRAAIFFPGSRSASRAGQLRSGPDLALRRLRYPAFGLVKRGPTGVEPAR